MMITDSEFIAVAPFNENNDSQVVAVENMTKRTKKTATIWYDIETFGMTSKHSAINSIISEFVKIMLKYAVIVCLEYCQIP